MVNAKSISHFISRPVPSKIYIFCEFRNKLNNNTKDGRNRSVTESQIFNPSSLSNNRTPRRTSVIDQSKQGTCGIKASFLKKLLLIDCDKALDSPGISEGINDKETAAKTNGISKDQDIWYRNPSIFALGGLNKSIYKLPPTNNSVSKEKMHFCTYNVTMIQPLRETFSISGKPMGF